MTLKELCSEKAEVLNQIYTWALIYTSRRSGLYGFGQRSKIPYTTFEESFSPEKVNTNFGAATFIPSMMKQKTFILVSLMIGPFEALFWCLNEDQKLKPFLRVVVLRFRF